jgi:transcriptional regulator of acetoin/glycerol metabolism/DNA-binding CsgD family transcriptional regulator
VPAEGVDRISSVLESEGATLHAEEVTDSWRRSLNDYGVDPSSPEAPRILTAQELLYARGPVEDLIGIAREENDRLFSIVGKVGYVVLFTSPTGVVVDVRGDPNRADEFAYWGVWRGGVWAEDVEGTNGIGTAIAEQRPVTVHRTQHFRTRNGSLSCCGAPVFGPDGSLAAVLDVSSIDPEISDRSHALALSVTMNSARVIEERLFRETFRRAWILTLVPAAPSGKPLMLALDDDQRILGADRNARATLRLDSAMLGAGTSLWTFFERAPSVFGARSEGVSVELTRNGEDRPWRAMLTPPLQPRIGHLDRLAPPARTESALSPRERNILELIGQGRSNKEIARLLGISPETVKSHIKNMFAKLGVESRTQALYRARIAG